MTTTIPPVSEGQLGSAREVCSLIGCSRVTLWRLLNTDQFPRPIRLAPNSPRSRLRFRMAEVIGWVLRQQALSVDAAEAGAGSLGIHLGR
jgi:predicted DNA-binding transcriptional regulator AlpA